MAIEDPFVRGAADLLGVHEVWVRSVGLVLLGLALGWLARRLLLTYGVRVATRTPTDLDEVLVQTIATPTGVTIAMLGIAQGLALVLEPERRFVVVERVLPSIILVVWGVALARLLSLLFLRIAARHAGRGRARGAQLAGRFADVFVAVAILIAIFAVWNVDVTPLLASAGLVGIALALAAQDTLSNLFAGVAVYMDNLYEVGDVVVLDAGTDEEVRGEVKDVGMRSTRILTRDDILVTVPNSVIANARVINESAHVAQYRVHVPVSVSYSSELDHVEDTLLRVARAHTLVLTEPAARARVRRFAESGIDWELLVWIRDPRDRGLVVHDLAKAIHKLFRKEGITIPFPQRDVHFVPPPEPPR